MRSRCRVVAVPPGQPARSAQRLAAHHRQRTGKREQTVQQSAALPHRSSLLPVPRERGGCPETDVGPLCLDGPVQCPPQVGDFAFASVQPDGLLLSGQVRLCFLRERQEELRHPVVGGVGVEIGPEPVGRVFQDRLEHAKTGLPVGCLTQSDEALADERIEPLQHWDASPFALGDRRGAFQRTARGEDRESREKAAFRLLEQVIAPFDGRSHRHLPLRSPSRG